MICCPLAYSSSLTQFYPPYLAQILGYVVTCGVKIMHFCHSWCWQPPQTASHLHIRHIQSDWAHWYAVHGHTVSPLHSYTHPAWLRFWGSGSLAKSKSCDYVMVEGDGHLKLLPTSILDMCKIFEHIDMLFTCIQYQPYTVLPTLLLGSDFGVLGHLWSQNDVIMSWLRLTATSNCSPPPYWEHWYAIHGQTVSALHSYTHPTWVRFWGSGSLLESQIMWLCHGWGWQPSQTASHIHIRHIQSIWAHWYAVHWHAVAALHSFTHPTWLRFWDTWSLVELKGCIFVMVDAGTHLKLPPTSILDAYIVIELIDMLSMGIQYHAYTVIPTLIGSDFGVLGHLWSQNDEIMSWLRLTATSNCFPYSI